MRTRNPLNLGAAARAISNFGFRHLRVVQPYERAFREARSAVGAGALMANAVEYKTVADAVADCSLVVGTTSVGERELQHPLKRLEEGSRLIRRRLGGKAGKGKVALLFGSERIGLTNDHLSHCDWLMRVPTTEAHRSMNLGQTVAVCLYELIRDSRSVGAIRKTQAATGAEIERVTAALLAALVSSGYLAKKPTADAEARARRLVRRLELTSRDAQTLTGMLRQMGRRP